MPPTAHRQSRRWGKRDIVTETVGFIGLGIMGRGMARNLLKAGYDLRVWNRTASRMDPLAAEGARPTRDPADLAAQCDLILICVSDTPDVEAVIAGDDPRGVLHGVRPGALVIDMSTISPHATRAFGARLAEKGAYLLDAPVSGGSEGAAHGTLSIMVGGAAEQVERARPVLQALGKTITHVGGLGDGQMVKLVNQILVVGHALAMSEALLFAQAGGLDLRKTLDAVLPGAAGSWMLANRGPQILDRDWRPGFTIDLQQKDVRLVLGAADQLGVPMLATGLVFQLYRTLQAAGLGAEGNHALIKALERLAGIEIQAAVAGGPGQGG
ncbi:MAG: NAD(P)-dependent oxidoreductase [Anaerolineales bacterium]|nr:NAD(P)-dependent oxidoreductase [Anaerolineales bacterium]